MVVKEGLTPTTVTFNLYVNEGRMSHFSRVRAPLLRVYVRSRREQRRRGESPRSFHFSCPPSCRHGFIFNRATHHGTRRSPLCCITPGASPSPCLPPLARSPTPLAPRSSRPFSSIAAVSFSLPTALFPSTFSSRLLRGYARFHCTNNDGPGLVHTFHVHACARLLSRKGRRIRGFLPRYGCAERIGGTEATPIRNDAPSENCTWWLHVISRD